MEERKRYNFDFEGKLVLVVEDNPISFKLIEAMLTRVNIQLIHASNGREAIDLCKKHPDIAIVLMDMQLPVMSGIEATKVIIEWRPGLPVIATTANAFSEDQDACMGAGCTAFVPKPIDFGELFSLMESILNSN
jgi:CheY-like chemotaxis protein